VFNLLPLQFGDFQFHVQGNYIRIFDIVHRANVVHKILGLIIFDGDIKQSLSRFHHFGSFDAYDVIFTIFHLGVGQNLRGLLALWLG
jgi:hypothetical protein